MSRFLIAGYQHETNTFAPSLADWAAFTRGDSFPAFVRGPAMVEQLGSVNIPIAGFLDAARTYGWQCVPSCWAGAIPSSFVTTDAFERIAGTICDDVRAACADTGGLDGIYLDLHGAAVAEHVPDTEGELLARLRQLVGPNMPIVASLDLHANVTKRMLAEADALVSYRTYPHVDMAATGVRAAQLMQQRLRAGQRLPMHARRLPFLIPLNAQSTWTQPAQAIYEELERLDRKHGTVLSFCMGFPASDFAECAPMVWGYGSAEKPTLDAVNELFDRAAEPDQWRQDVLSARDAVAQALALAEHTDRPVVIADTQDNPGAGGDSNTTGMLHALLAQGAGRRFPGQVALGMLFDREAGKAALAAGVGATLDMTVGRSVPTFTGQPSDPPLHGRFTVRAVSDGRVTLKGPMMTGLTVALGPSACLEIEGVQIAV
ncbi:MAG TPA: M81 family metallopeptidase, partial [Ramlibacter sp.]|nr:M81 family metallopeptidase [Ramlibacter sp.]